MEVAGGPRLVVVEPVLAGVARAGPDRVSVRQATWWVVSRRGWGVRGASVVGLASWP